VPAIAGPWRTYALSEGVTFRAPARWHTTTYRGYPATIYFPSRYLSTDRFTGPCAHGNPKSSCTGHHWFPDGWTTPVGGVMILWSEAESPWGPGLDTVPGRRTTIGGDRAMVSGALSRCPRGAATEIDAYIAVGTRSDPTERLDMTGCIGPAAAASDRRAVRRVLRSLRIRGG
jgi:hypothetical protein